MLGTLKRVLVDAEAFGVARRWEAIVGRCCLQNSCRHDLLLCHIIQNTFHVSTDLCECWCLLQWERNARRCLLRNTAHRIEDLRSLLERKDEDLRSKDKELSELHPLVAQSKFQQHELLRYKNIVSCRGALELVAAQQGLPNASDMKGWRNEFGGTLAPVLKSCNLTEKVFKDNK